MEFFLVYGSIIWFLLSHIPYKNLRSCPWLIFEVFTGLWLSTPTFVQKVVIMLNVLSVVLVLLVINTGCPKNLLKMGNTAL